MTGLLTESPPRERATRGVVDLRARLLIVLALAAFTELVLQRTFYRVGIFLPKQGPFGSIYRLGTALGSLSFNLASVLVMLVLASTVHRLVRGGRDVTGVLTGSVLVLALVSPLFHGDPLIATLYRLLFLLAGIAAVSPSLRCGSRADRVVTAGLLAAVSCSVYFGVANGVMQAGGFAGVAPGALLTLGIGERLVLLLGPLFLLAWHRTEPAGPATRMLGLAAIPALGLLTAVLMTPRYTGILAIWTVGLSFVAPPALYAASLWLFLAAMLGFLHRAETRARGIALVLLIAGGYFPQTTYEFLLCLTALLLWSEPERA